MFKKTFNVQITNICFDNDHVIFNIQIKINLKLNFEQVAI